MIVSSFVEGEWFSGKGSPREIFHAVSGEKVAEASSEGIDFAGALKYARTVGGPALRKMTFHERSFALKLLAKHLMEKKEQFYELSQWTGATKADSWIDIEGGIGTVFTYASKGRRELPDLPFHVEGETEQISKTGTFVGRHLCVPLEGVALHINAFNFPCWGMLEKLAPTLIAGMPAIVKPATSTSYLARAMFEEIINSDLLPEGSLQFIAGGVGDTFEHLTCQDIVTLTGSKATGVSLKQHPVIIDNAVRFNLEADSLNCSILGNDAAPGTELFDLFVKEVAKEISVKAGQKCTAIRRVIVPKELERDVIEAISARLQKITVGNPQSESVRMGPLVSKAQVEDVGAQVEQLKQCADVVYGSNGKLSVVDADPDKGAFFAPTLLHCKDPFANGVVHEVEAFGPVSTVMSYKSLEEAAELAKLGGGSLVASAFTESDEVARSLTLNTAAYHGRIMLMSPFSAKESTGHGSPLPHLVHGGPGRAGGGEELGGIRAVLHYMQRTAIQGSPQQLTAVSGIWHKRANVREEELHPFRKYYEEIEIGDSILTHRRTITETDVVNFAGVSGDFFYVHTDDIAVKDSIFEKRVAHGYLVLSMAAGLFVDPRPGPLVANYGLESLRFIEPVFIGDSIRVRLTCKEKMPKDIQPHGVVAWDAEIFNQDDTTVAVYTILTLVKKKHPPENEG